MDDHACYGVQVEVVHEQRPLALGAARRIHYHPAVAVQVGECVAAQQNIELDPGTASQILDWIELDLPGRLVTQVSRFDQWKDPLGVIDAYRLVREEIGDLQLALVGSMALDDPEGWDVYRQVSDVAERDPLIHAYTNLTGVGNVEVNAFQRLSEVVVQKSIREGFGLVVSESLWKGTPVVAGRARGHPAADAGGRRRPASGLGRGVCCRDVGAAERPRADQAAW
jgi:glycosyltransferase involved in cell wall biosynthesis